LDVPARIANEIQTMINRGTLSPGVHLGQAELAERFSTSRVPVREALKLLAAHGSLQHDPNRGFFVAPLSSDEASQLYRMRHLLEVELLTTVEWPDKARLATLRNMVNELEELVAADDRMGWATKHREFQIEVFSLSPQKLILREATRLWALTDRYRSLLLATAHPKKSGKLSGGSEEERKLIAALEKRDLKKLLAVYEEERTNVREVLLGVLKDRGL
jgi:DNA-binding GntR family transcriptional regulator